MSFPCTHPLPNSLILEFRDLSNRYFGDYWRVCVEVRCRIPLQSAFPDPLDPEAVQARTIVGDEVIYSRMLERMGVAGEEVEAARESLIQGFLDSAGDYLGHPGFPLRFFRQQVAGQKKIRPFTPVRQ